MTGPRDDANSLRVRSWEEVPEFVAHGVRVRAVFFPSSLELSDNDGVIEFESPLAYVLHNRLEAGATNETHVHDDEEKVHFVIRGSARLHCGEVTAEAASGQYFYFPAQIPHSIESLGPDDLEYVVCAVKTTPRT